MESHTEDGAENNQSSIEENRILQLPLLEELRPQSPPTLGSNEKLPKNPAQKVVRKAFKGTAHLSNLLPTGSVLAFQVLSPAFTHEGKCQSPVSRTMTLGLIGVCAISCFLLNFTDSYRDERGKVRYGVATIRGLWVFDDSNTLPLDGAKFRLRFVDFFHAVMSVLVFAAVAMFDQNVVKCLYPSPSPEAMEILTTMPVIVGVICSIFFLLFPTKRHGIGFPLSRR